MILKAKKGKSENLEILKGYTMSCFTTSCKTQRNRIIDAPVIMILSVVQCLHVICNLEWKISVTFSDAALSGIVLRQLAAILALGQDLY